MGFGFIRVVIVRCGFIPVVIGPRGPFDVLVGGKIDCALGEGELGPQDIPAASRMRLQRPVRQFMVFLARPCARLPNAVAASSRTSSWH